MHRENGWSAIVFFVLLQSQDTELTVFALLQEYTTVLASSFAILEPPELNDGEGCYGDALDDRLGYLPLPIRPC
jgi:hypothetical protein